MQQIPFLKKTIKQQQTELIEDLEGLGDILVFLTKNKRNSEVLPTLRELGSFINKFFDLQKSDPDKFEKLMLAEEYWTDYKEDKNEAQLRLSFTPERYLITFSTLLNQILRVFESAIKVDNDEITRHACYQLVIFLAKVSEIEKSDLFVKEILKRLLEFSRKSIESKSSATHASTYSWYVDVVFNKLGQEKGFRYEEYLDLFNQYFLENVKFLITQNQFELFKSLVGFLIDGVHVSTHDVNKLWDYLDLLTRQDMASYRRLNEEANITRLIIPLVDDVKKIYTSSQLQEWLLKYEEFKGIVYPLLNPANKTKANRIEKEIKSSVVQCYVNQTLKGLIFTAGAWAVYKNQPKFISEIWTHKQPEDARASYGGNDLFPQSLSEAVVFYFRSSVDDIFFWDDHHDGQIYISQYFLLLLSRYLKTIPSNLRINNTEPVESTYHDIETFELPFDRSSELSNIKFEAEGLLVTAEGLKELALLEELSIAEDREQAIRLIDTKLIPFIKRLIVNADEKIKRIQVSQPLSEEKIEEFKNEVYGAYSDSASLKKVFEDNGIFEDKVAETEIVQLPIIGFDEVRHRDMFFEDWHVSYSDWGKNYGRGIGEAEDSSIATSIIESLPETTNISLEDVLSGIEITENTIIFTSYDYLYEHLERTGHFRPYWTENVNREQEPHFQGWLVLGNNRIKVYNYHIKQVEMYYAVFNIDSIGKLVHHYPLIAEDDPSFLFKNLRIKTIDFSTDEQFIQTLLENPPQWVPSGSEEQQRLYVRQFLLLQVGTKFEFIKSENPTGIAYIQRATQQ
ncbi:MAG: hypothetical protein KBC00_02385 [Candidatus Levybacteria bacterium]|nr:hypothetical protein [Candidatus Levybacteria bacterium]MBP9815421.1 hypothetical protein [Candidatus Levybacteria bacterium]